MATIESLRLFLIVFTAIASGLSAGIFYAFSTFVMKALAQQPSAQGIATMQSINITVINPWFMVAFFGPAVACILLSISLISQGDRSIAISCILGSLLYLIGTIGVTIACNIPLNDALAVVKPDSTEGATLWSRYLTDWTFWNHVRTIAALLAAAMFTISLCQRTGLTT